MNHAGTPPRPRLIERLRAAFSGTPWQGTPQSTHMPDLETWRMPHRAVDMRDWNVALNMAQNAQRPDRTKLLDLYDSILVDSHLAAAVESRVLRVVRSKWRLVDRKGKPLPELNELLEQQWFEDFLKYVAEAKFRGHTLIELSDLAAPGELTDINRIDPRNVLPWTGVVVRRPGETTGYKFREAPLKDYLIEVGRADDLGLLSQVAPVAVVKKYAIGSWSDFVEKFGIPPRWVQTGTTDKKRFKQLQTMMQEMVSSAYAVINTDEKIEIMPTPGTDAHKVFDELISRMNSEMSKRILGQDGTSDNKDASGTYGSLKVLAGVAEDRHQADKSAALYVINNELLPRLTLLGYPFKDVRFQWDELRDLSPTEVVDAVSKLGLVFDIDPKYVEERTGMRILGARRMPGEAAGGTGNPPVGPPTDPPVDPPGNPPKKGKQPGAKKSGGGTDPRAEAEDEPDGATIAWPQDRLVACSQCGGIKGVTALSAPEIPASAMAQMLVDAHDGGQWSQPYFDAVSNVLQEGVLQNWRQELSQLTYDAPDHAAAAVMQANIFRFSAAKTLALSTDLNQYVKESKGFADFKRKVDESGKLEDYNKNWLRTEYANAVNTGMQGSRWYQMQRSSDALPFGEYWTQQDAQVRPAHAELNGKTWPLSDPIWARIWPPNAFGCRCTVLPTQDGPTGEAADQQRQASLEDLASRGELERMQKTGFDSNKAITGEVFKVNSAYREQLGAKAGKPVTLNVAESYGPDASKRTLEAINAGPLPAARPGYTSEQDALLRTKGQTAVYNDYAGRPWPLHGSTIKEHLMPKYASEERYKTLNLVPDILSAPDEVWLNSKGGDTQRLTYIKFYKGNTMVVRGEVDLKEAQPMRIGSWYTMDPAKEAQQRSGLLIKKMPG